MELAFLKKTFLYPLILIVLTGIVYILVLNHDFLYLWDDQWVVINHYTEGGINFQNLWAIFTQFYRGQYAPLNELYYLLIYSCFGYDPFYFHLGSILIHISNVLMVYSCVILLLGLQKRKQSQYPYTTAFIAALIFAVHPFNVESVAWVSASKILIYAFFYLAATIFFLNYLKSGKLSWYVVTFLFFIFSFWGKEQAVIFPVWMILLYWWTGHKLNDINIWKRLLPFFVFALFFGIITMLSQSATGTGVLSNQTTYPLWQRLVYACYSYSEYFIKCLVPFKLSYLYPFPSIVGESLPAWLLIYPILLCIIFLSFYKYVWRNELLFFSIMLFTIHIAVALHIIPLSRFAVVADRYVYISSIGIALLLSHLIIMLTTRYVKVKRLFVIAMFLIYIAYLAGYAHIRTHVWHDTQMLKKEIRELLKVRNDYECK